LKNLVGDPLFQCWRCIERCDRLARLSSGEGLLVRNYINAYKRRAFAINPHILDMF
jgi:hypothetical protein